MKIIILAIGLLAVFIGLLACLRLFHPKQLPPVFVNSGPTIEKLERLSHLVTTRVQIAVGMLRIWRAFARADRIRGSIRPARRRFSARPRQRHRVKRRRSIPVRPMRPPRSMPIGWRSTIARPTACSSPTASPSTTSRRGGDGWSYTNHENLAYSSGALAGLRWGSHDEQLQPPGLRQQYVILPSRR